MRADGGAAIEEGAPSRRDLLEHAAGDDIARAQLGAWIDARHEALALRVDEDRAFAAQCLRGERGRVGTNVDRCRMELDELGIADDRAGARRHGDRFTARVRRVGRHGIKRADAAGREHDRAGREEFIGAVAEGRGAHQTHAGNAAIDRYELIGLVAFEHADRWGRAHSCNQRPHDLGARAIAGDMHDTAPGVRRLAAEQEPAVGVAVERNAVADEICNACGSLRGDEGGDGCIYDAGAGRDRVGGMQGGAVVVTHRCRDAGLRPDG